jgi:thiol-disulfide isomerase/thioredoxin
VSTLPKLAARALLLGTLLSTVACQEEQQKPISAPRERSQAVQASVGTVAAAAPNPTAAAASASAPAKPRRSLCAGQMREGKALPKKPISQAPVAGARPLPENLSGDSGSWTWLNFWAAWCAPCKEEIPRLVNWERELKKAGRHFRVAFISLDDDERQLKQFLESQSSLHESYWLKEGKERDEWMKGALLDSDPELPIHLLLDPHGKVRCKVQGAVEDADYQDLSRLLSEKASE